MKKGFTLIELLTVVLIIAVLTSIALPKYMRSVERARATEAMASIKALNDAVYAYAAGRSGANACPDSFLKLVVSFPGSLTASDTMKSRDFTYQLNKATNAVIPGTDCAGVVATRNANGKFDYQIWNPFIVGNSGKGKSLACHGTTEDSKNICESLQIYTENTPF